MRNSLYFTIWDAYSLNWWSMITSGDSLTGKVFIYKFNDIYATYYHSYVTF